MRLVLVVLVVDLVDLVDFFAIIICLRFALV